MIPSSPAPDQSEGLDMCTGWTNTPQPHSGALMPLANLDWCPLPPGIQPLLDDNSVESIRSESCTLLMGGGDSALVWLKVDEVNSSRPGSARWQRQYGQLAPGLSLALQSTSCSTLLRQDS